MDDATDSETTTKHDEPATLLEDLRAKRLEVNDWTDEEKLQKMMVAIQAHRNEFPEKLRPIIDRASGQWLSLEPKNFIAAVYGGLKDIFLGRSVEHTNVLRLMINRANDDRSIFSNDWHGIDKETDTEDQVEVAIRCFPQVLKEKVQVWVPTMGPRHHAVYLALTSPRAVPFVPVMIQLTCELDGELGDSSPLKSIKLFKQILVNRYPRWVFGQESSKELDEESLKALVRLKDTGTIATEDLETHVLDLIQYLFFQPVMKPEQPFLESSLIETRLRLLLDWHPLLSMEEILCNFLKTFSNYPIHESVGRAILSTILDYGLTRAPLELGFLFHKYYFSNACEYFGTAVVLEMFRDKLVRALEEDTTTTATTTTTRTLRAWVAEVAANDEISLDGLYTLIRLDPIEALLPVSRQPLPPMVE
jgi:hypothetical protein